LYFQNKNTLFSKWYYAHHCPVTHSDRPMQRAPIGMSLRNKVPHSFQQRPCSNPYRSDFAFRSVHYQYCHHQSLWSVTDTLRARQF